MARTRPASSSRSTARHATREAWGRLWSPPEDHFGQGIGARPEWWNKAIKLHDENLTEFRFRSRNFADSLFSDISAPPVTIEQNAAAGDPHRYHLILLSEGLGTHSWNGGTCTQKAGDLVLLDMAQPTRLVSPECSRLVRWSFPEAVLAPFLSEHDTHLLHLPADHGLNAVITRYAKQLLAEAERLDPAIQHGLLAHLCGLLGVASEALRNSHPPERRQTYRTYQRQRVLAYIDTRLSDNRLTARRAAKDLGMSPRWMRKLLEDIGMGFPDIVARRRLDRSVSLLRNPAAGHLSIAEIAFSTGFGELSTFYRRFKERYRMTPNEVRRLRKV